MRRVAPNLPVSPVMLRHFAVVTLVATAGLAMFASGENSSALAEAQRAAQARGGGAWGTSPRKTSENKTATTVNGMHVAAGTRLERNGGAGYEPEGPRIEQEVQGDIRNIDPEYRALLPGSLGPGAQAGAASAQAVAAQAPIQRDRNGIPLPPGASGQAKPSASAKPLPPRRATSQDIERMMEASRLRSSTGKAGADSEGSFTPAES